MHRSRPFLQRCSMIAVRPVPTPDPLRDRQEPLMEPTSSQSVVDVIQRQLRRLPWASEEVRCFGYSGFRFQSSSFSHSSCTTSRTTGCTTRPSEEPDREEAPARLELPFRLTVAEPRQALTMCDRAMLPASSPASSSRITVATPRTIDCITRSISKRRWKPREPDLGCGAISAICWNKFDSTRLRGVAGKFQRRPAGGCPWIP
jgi:hypothetical protein